MLYLILLNIFIENFTFPKKRAAFEKYMLHTHHYLHSKKLSLKKYNLI